MLHHFKKYLNSYALGDLIIGNSLDKVQHGYRVDNNDRVTKLMVFS